MKYTNELLVLALVIVFALALVSAACRDGNIEELAGIIGSGT